MSLVQFAHDKNAVAFKKAFLEKTEEVVGNVLTETKIALASKLLSENPNGITSSAGGEKTKAEGGMVGKDRLPDTTDIKSSEGGNPPGGTKLAHVETKPGTSLAVNPTMPGKTNEESEPKKEPSEHHASGKGKRAVRFAMKKKYDKRQNESVTPIVEKVIDVGSVDHMAHAVHSCVTGKVPVAAYRGTFTHYEHPDYAIHKDHGGINPDKPEHNYYVVGKGGVHHFAVEHTKNGVDVKHRTKLS